MQSGIGSLLCIFHAAFNPAATLLGKVSDSCSKFSNIYAYERSSTVDCDICYACVQFHYFLYFVAPAAQPMMLITVNEDLEPCSKSVRVGERVDTVGQPGPNPRVWTSRCLHVALRIYFDVHYLSCLIFAMSHVCDI